MLLEKDKIKSFKPGVNRKVHLFAAAFLWTAVGIFLILRGWNWLDPAVNGWFIPLAILLGSAKSFFILDRTARRGVERISSFSDGTCLGAVYSWKTWILVVVMVSSGILLRTYFDPGKYIGTLYCAIGWALLLSSRFSWKEWLKQMAENE